MAHKRIRPVMKRVERDSPDLNWAPVAVPLYSFVSSSAESEAQAIGAAIETPGPLSLDSVAVRAGESFALVRRGFERHPFGICSDHYDCSDHVKIDASIREGCGQAITPHAVMMAGHGYQVAYGYSLKHLQATRIIEGNLIRSLSTGLIISHDHTGKGALRASMCLYLDRKAIGSIVYTTAMHVGAQPAIWQANIEAMIETALIAQDAIVETITLASKRSLTEEDREFLKGKGLRCPESVTTALGALVEHHEGRNQTMTWGVWERRMLDSGFRAVLALIGNDVAATLDETLRSRVLSCVPQRYGRKRAA